MIQDTLELDFLSQLQAKRSAELRVQEQQAWGLKYLMNGMRAQGVLPTNGPMTPMDVAAAQAQSPASVDTPTLGGGLGAMVNRSPTTIHNYYPATTTEPVSQPTTQPSPVPTPAPSGSLSPWLMLLPLVLALGMMAWMFWPKPTKPIPPGGEAADTTIILRDAP